MDNIIAFAFGTYKISKKEEICTHNFAKKNISHLITHDPNQKPKTSKRVQDNPI